MLPGAWRIIVGSELDRASYPGLNVTATALWRTFLKYYETSFESFAYNVRVGQGITPPAYFSEDEKKQWISLTQKRVDVVAERNNQSWILEIQERTDLRSLGQLMGYKHLVPAYTQVREVLMLGMITARLGHDMALSLRQNGILVFFFPPGKAPSFPPTFPPSYAVSPA
jgi:hypothetical protein